VGGPVRIVPLGGLGEIGMNCMALEEEGRIVVVDCGVLFDGRGLGVEVIHADWEWLFQREDDVEALVLTHGHEDHLGAVSWFLRDFDVPVYGPPYALALVRERMAQHAWHAGKKADLRPLLRGDVLPLGPFTFEPFQVTHSMPECMGLAIRTGQGLVVHSGDFKIDDSPPPGDRFDFERLKTLGDEGVRLLMSDSTNAMSPGRAIGELEVRETLAEQIAAVKGRVVVGLFASNVHRTRSLIDIARQLGRKVIPLGRSVDTHLRIATELRLLPDPTDVLVPRGQARTVARERALVLATGSQGEPRAALPRLAHGSHPDLELAEGDVVLLSSRVIPGNERPILDMIETLERRGIRVISRATESSLHASGHAHQGELADLMQMLRPKAFVPIHGTFLHMRAHAELASERGVPQILRALNGDAIEIEGESLRIAERVWAGRVHVDQGGEPVDGRVLSERRSLAELGIVTITVAVDRAGRAVSPPRLSTSGVFHPEDDADLVQACERAAHREIADLVTPKITADEDAIAEALRRAVRRVCQRELGKKPIVLASVHVVGQT
jgi:ribonuclease J